MFSRLQELNKFMHRNSDVWLQKFQLGMEQAKRYVRFCTQVYEHQRKHGRYLLHQHPWLATRGTMDVIDRLLSHDDVQRVQTHMCQFGMTSRIGGVGSELGPVRKPTGFMTNCPGIARELARLCPRDHKACWRPSCGSGHLPEKLCIAICRGLTAQKREDKTRTIRSLPMSAERLSFPSLLCCEALGGYPPEIVNNGKFSLDNIQIEVDGQGRHTGKFRKLTRLAGVASLPGDWPAHWSDYIHEFDEHGIGVEAEDRTGEEMMNKHLSALYVQHGVEAACDDVSGAWLDPKLVHERRR
jgi:hypothetical protein